MWTQGEHGTFSYQNVSAEPSTSLSRVAGSVVADHNRVGQEPADGNRLGRVAGDHDVQVGGRLGVRDGGGDLGCVAGRVGCRGRDETVDGERRRQVEAEGAIG